ncbi:MAG: hypothetical protein A4E62_02017 [Syntrophorhabdus sp. PtaU1.Bin002]|nr:MAG: hypothetical protein A4E58_01499 [Syntrophorhabdus sp. PtaB.Bin006]OPY68615.1 MAG: hypothetical protein A4E62_02017 [Syntrophorhabdus sp. PtaU1.Bin002]
MGCILVYSLLGRMSPKSLGFTRVSCFSLNPGDALSQHKKLYLFKAYLILSSMETSLCRYVPMAIAVVTIRP